MFFLYHKNLAIGYIYVQPAPLFNQSIDSTDGFIVFACRLKNGPERGLQIVSFNP